MTTFSVEYFESMGYFDVKELPDGTFVGKLGLLFTTAICMGLDTYGWEKRFCYEDRVAMQAAYDSLTSGDDEPTGWVARRGG